MKIIKALLLALLLSSLIACTSGLDQSVELTCPQNTFLWVGLNQPIYLSAQNEEDFELRLVDSTVAELVRNSQGYYIKPKRRENINIEIYQKVGTRLEYLKTHLVKVKSLPNLRTFLAGKPGGKISINQLSSYPEIRVQPINFDIDISFNISSFNLVVFNQDGYPQIISSDKGSLNQAQLDVLNKLKNGMRFYIEDIQLTPNEVLQNPYIPPQSFEIILGSSGLVAPKAHPETSN